MSTTVDNIDEDQLQQAQKALGAASPEDTVNQALREVVRGRLVDAYVSTMSQRDPGKLEDDRRAAWR